MLLKKFIAILLLLGLYYSGSGQILNIEKSRVNQDTANYLTGDVGFNLNLFNRNAGADNPNNYFNIRFKTSLAYLSQEHSYLLLGQLDYVEVTSNPVVRGGYLHARTNFLRRQRLSHELFTQYQYDRIRGLRDRFLIGGGLRWRWLESEKSTLYLGAGVMYELEDWQDPVLENNLISPNLLKSANYLSVNTAFNSHVSLHAIAYYQTGYDNSIDAFRHRVSATATLQVKLSSKLTFKTSFDGVYENKPIIPITRFIYSLNNGLTVSF